MAIGMNPRKKGLFGKPFEVPGTPGIGDGMDQVPTGVDPAPGLGMRGEAQPEKMGLGSRLFGRGWEDKAFALGGIMRGDPSGAYMIQQDKRAEQQALAQQAADLRKRSLDWADTKREIDYRAQNEVPTIQRNAEYIRQTQGEDVANEYIRNYGQRPEEPRMVNIPGVGSYFGTMSEIQQMLGGAKPQGQSYDPNEWEDYDGGPTQPASGGF